MKVLKCISILILFVMVSCVTLQLNQVKEIQFGNGGGFTGSSTTYTLKSNGQLFKNNLYINKINKHITKLFFDRSDSCLTISNTINPGNTYNFLSLRTTSDNIYYAWQSGTTIDRDIMSLYTDLINLISNEKN